MMKNEIVKLTSSILAAYPNSKKYTPHELDTWFQQLKGFPLQACLEHLIYHIRWEKYPPTLVDFVKAGPATDDDLKRLFKNWREK